MVQDTTDLRKELDFLKKKEDSLLAKLSDNKFL